MTLGPIEVVVIAFPGNRFSGKILPELTKLLEARTISIVDGLFLLKDESGEVTFMEIDEEGSEDLARLARLCDRFDELITDEDVEALSADLEPNSSAAILAFEHTWVRPLRDAIIEAGGILSADIHVPPDAVDEVMSSLQGNS